MNYSNLGNFWTTWLPILIFSQLSYIVEAIFQQDGGNCLTQEEKTHGGNCLTHGGNCLTQEEKTHFSI